VEPQPPAPGAGVPPARPSPEPVVEPGSPEALGTDGQAASDPGRIARARRSATELETRARREFERARDRHASVRILVQAFESDRRRAGGLLAGGLAYKIFLWQIPLVLFLVSAFGLVLDFAGDDPADVARQTGMTAALASAIAKAVAASSSARWWLMLLGAFVTIWAGRGVYRGVRLVSELAWDARAPKGHSLKGSLVVTGIGLLAIAMQVLLLKAFSALDVPGVVEFLVGLFLASALSLWMLSLLPRDDASWPAVLPGAILFGVGLRLLGLAASTYFAVRLDRTSDLYGALGIAIVMMLYLFVLARLFVAAQFLNATLYRRRQRVVDAEA
jgi:membrane protein